MRRIDGIYCRHKPYLRNDRVRCEHCPKLLGPADLSPGQVIPFTGRVPYIIVDGDSGLFIVGYTNG